MPPILRVEAQDRSFDHLGCGVAEIDVARGFQGGDDAIQRLLMMASSEDRMMALLACSGPSWFHICTGPVPSHR